jgi:membrane-associated protein
MQELFDLMLHADEAIGLIIEKYGALTYFLLFLIVFVETGLVVVMIFPCDGLLFAAGLMAAAGRLDLSLLLILASVATILGNTSNFLIGEFIGQRFLGKRKNTWTRYLDKAREYYEKYGGLAVFFSRYVPFMRSFVPFVAGLSRMPFWRYSVANIAGGIVWVSTYLLLGYYLGDISLVRENFGLVFTGLLFLLLVVTLAGLVRSGLRRFSK